MTTFLSIVLLGAVVGSIYSLAACGLVLTFRTSGVFNFAQGAMGTLAAYVFFQLTQGGQVNLVVGKYDQHWRLPVGVALVVVVAVLAPAFGLALDLILFRRLRTAGGVVQIVATIGLLIAFVGVATVAWGTGTALTPRSIFSTHTYHWGPLRVSVEKLATIGVVLALVFGLIQFLRRSRLGVRMRAVVDRAEVAELMGVDSGRVSAFAWMVATAFAALAGILVVPFYRTLDPFTLSFLVIAVTAAAVVGKLESLPLTLVGGFGIALAQFFVQQYGSGELARQLRPSIPFAVLFLVLMVIRRWPAAGPVTAPRPTSALAPPASRTRSVKVAVLAVVLVGPAFLLGSWPSHVLGGDWQTQLSRVPGMAIIFLSLVVLTGYTGQISLGQAALAGFGAFVTAHLVADHGVPFLLACAIAAVATVPLGAMLALPAARLPPLFLGFATLAFAAVMDQVAFTSPSFSGGLSGIFFRRASFLESARAYYLFGLGVFALLALLATNLRRGRTGLAFAAMRDSPLAVASAGTSVARLKYVSFCLSAFVAGLGGALFAGADRLATSYSYNNLASLLFVALAVIGGIRTWTGALAGAALFQLSAPILHQPFVQGNFVGKDVFNGQLEALLPVLFGLGAIGLAANPNGVVEQTREGWARFRDRVRRARTGAAPDVAPVPAPATQGAGDLVRFPKARHYHRAACSLTIGKQGRPVTAAGARRLSPCPVCEPEPGRPMRGRSSDVRRAAPPSGGLSGEREFRT